MTRPQHDIIRQISGLSSGTLASLTGLRRYTELDAVHTAFINFATARTEFFKTWQEAWRDFQATAAPPVPNVPKGGAA